jgi:predicted peptidase
LLIVDSFTNQQSAVNNESTINNHYLIFAGTSALMTTTPLLALIAAALVAQSALPTFERRTLKMPDGSTVRYGLAVPGDYRAAAARPLVIALHPGGGGTPYYGDQFMRTIFVPGLRELGAITIAPDCPTRAWTDPHAEQAVMSLIKVIRDEFSIDERRIVVAGFSLGGAGTWFLSARHPDLFTAAIVMAGRSAEPLTNLARIPTYVIHSRDDQVVPFAQAEQRAGELERMGRPIRFDALAGVGHYDMARYLPALQNGGRWVRERWGK